MQAEAAAGADSQDEDDEMPPAEPLQAAPAKQPQAATLAGVKVAEKAKQKAEGKQTKQKEPGVAVEKDDKKRKRAADGAAAAAAGASAALKEAAAAAAAPGDIAAGDVQKPVTKKQRRSGHMI